MNIRAASTLFDYKPRQPVPFKSERNPLRDLQEENPLSAQVFEVAHVGTEVLLDHAHTGILGVVGGGAAAAVGVVSLGWGIARLRSEALPDKIDGIGQLALAGSASIVAVEQLAHLHLPGHGPLEVVHGLATAGLGVSELIRSRREGGPERVVVGAMGVAMGMAIVGAGVFHQAAPALHLVALGALAVKEAALNRDRLPLTK